MAQEIKITKHYFQFGTIKYFRGKAENVELCSYGEKKDPFGPEAYLAVEAKVKREHLKDRLRFLEPVDVNWSQQSKADVEVNGRLQYFGLNGKVMMSGSYEHAKSANLKLMKFFINAGPLKTMLNKDANGARNYLAEEGRDGRIVSEIWVVMEGGLAESFATSGAINTSVNAVGGDLELTVEGGTYGSQTVKFPEGMTFAYLMHKVKKWNKGKTQIEDMEDDEKGMN